MKISSVCVYCGSSDRVDEAFKDSAKRIGTELAKRKLRVIFGGGHVGLMGILSDAAINAGAEVVGIIPEHLRYQEVENKRVSELHIVPDMHSRKRMMVDAADAFIVLPGGFGTLDEAFEILTWKKLKLHVEPVILFNQNGYWDPMIALINRLIEEGFAEAADLSLFDVVEDVDSLLALLDGEKLLGQSSLTGRM
ncbi:MAG: TIGR00730 family Rossman fold protein [Alphaproteobacteria bacterium]|nr:TIGR00730 family Rossman fold protein [Alphaproteobacteria bacterium]